MTRQQLLLENAIAIASRRIRSCLATIQHSIAYLASRLPTFQRYAGERVKILHVQMYSTSASLSQRKYNLAQHTHLEFSSSDYSVAHLSPKVYQIRTLLKETKVS